VTTDVYLQPDAPDPVFDPAVVLSLVRRHVPAYEVHSVEESGGEARAYLVDDAVVLKVQRPHRLRARTSLEKEAFFLRELGAYEDLSVPRLLGYGREDSIEYICMTRMAGIASNKLNLSRPERLSLLLEVGRALRKLHSIDQTAIRRSGLFPGDQSVEELRSRVKAIVNQAAAAAKRQGTWTLAIAPDTLGARISELIRGAAILSALHSNPGPEHVFADPISKRFSGLIDFGDAYVSHPGFDVRWPLPADREAILAGYLEAGELNEDFLSTWRAIQIARDMSTAFSDRNDKAQRAQAIRNLEEEINRL
jgi:hygromycin-B 7''-O-kinase